MKKFLALMLALVMVFALAACGEEPAPSDESDAPSGESPAGEPVADNGSITYWSMWNSNEAQAQVIQEAAEAFKAATGITVNIEWRGRDITTQITAALESETEIDLFDDDFQRVAEQYNDHLLDLTSLVETNGYAEKVQPLFLEIAKDYSEGALYTIPYQLYTSGIVYSADAFEAAGVDPASIDSWDGLIAACAALKEAGYVPFALDGGGSPRYMYSYFLARLIGQDAVKELSLNGGWAESEGAKQAAEYIIELRDNGYVLDPIGTYPEGEYTLGYDETAMIILPDYVISEVINGTGTEIEWGFIPVPDLGGPEDETYANVGAQGFGIPAYSEKSEEAFQFIEFLTTGEWDAKLAEVSLHSPRDVSNETTGLVAMIQESISELTGYYDYQCGSNENPDIRLNTEVQGLFEGQYATADEFLAACDSRY